MLTNSSETHRVYLTGGGGPYLFIAIPMIVMGCYLSYLAVSSWFRNTEPFSIVIIFLIVGSVFMLVGLLLMLFREGITLDRIRGTASRWRKLFRRKTNLCNAGGSPAELNHSMDNRICERKRT